MAGQKTKRKSKSGRKKVKSKGTASEREDKENLDVHNEQGSDGSDVSQPMEKGTGYVEAEETKGKGTTATPTNSPANTPISSPTRTAATTAHLTTDQSPIMTPEKKIENTPVNSPSKSPFRNLFRNLVRSPAKTATTDATTEDITDTEENVKIEQPDHGQKDMVTSLDAEEVVQSFAPASPTHAQNDAEDPDTPELQPDARQSNPSEFPQSPSKMSEPVLEATPKMESKVADIAPNPEVIATAPEKVSRAVDPVPTDSHMRDTTIQLESSRKCGCIIC